MKNLIKKINMNSPFVSIPVILSLIYSFMYMNSYFLKKEIQDIKNKYVVTNHSIEPKLDTITLNNGQTYKVKINLQSYVSKGEIAYIVKDGIIIEKLYGLVLRKYRFIA